MDVDPVPPGGQDAEVGQALELVRNGLRLHADRGGEVGDTEFVGPHQGVKEPQAGVVRQDLEHGGQPARLDRGQQRAVFQGRFGAAIVLGSYPFHFSPASLNNQ